MPVTINGTIGETTPATVYSGSSSGSITVQAPAVAGTNTLTLPAATGTVLTTAGGQTISGTTTITTLNSPASTALTIQSAGTTAMTVDTSQNVGIGTTSPVQKLHIANGNVYFSTTNYVMWDTNGNYGIQSDGSSRLSFFSGSGSERARIDSTGALWVGYTSQIFSASPYKVGISFDGSAQQGIVIKNTVNNNAGAAVRFVDYLGNFSGGGIYYSSSNSISYATTSDYRLKHDVSPLANALQTISALNPVTYKWKVDNSTGEGFIAHELQDVIPHAVTGQKDAVNEDGSINAQGVDYSKIVVHLVAAVQELSAKVDAQAAEIAALKASKT